MRLRKFWNQLGEEESACRLLFVSLSNLLLPGYPTSYSIFVETPNKRTFVEKRHLLAFLGGTSEVASFGGLRRLRRAL